MQGTLDFAFVSADSHVTEPPNCYIDHIDPAYRDRAPYITNDEKRGDLYIIPGLERLPVPLGLMAAAGEESGTLSFFGRRFEDLHKGGWDPKYRMADQARDGVAGEILFASVGMPLANHNDLDYRRACMEAYNRWLTEYCSYAPDRLYGCGQAAIKNPQDGIEEIRAIKDAGFVGVMMAGAPGESDYDDPIYDPLWAAAQEMDIPLCFHILTSRHDSVAYGHVRGPKINSLLNVIRGCQDIMGMLVFAGVFERFPDLKIVCVEADAGWVPHYTYRMDHIYKRHRFWNKAQELEKLPSEYFFNNIWLTFQDDWTAFRCADQMNVDRLMWANDFPHSDSTWPLSQELLKEHTVSLSAHDCRRILRDNCVELFAINPPEQVPAAN
jgi:predicted TIM-barrel fold metal-dependent hydrolase